MSLPSRSYCAILIPDAVLAEDVESLADAGTLPTHTLTATSAEQAMRTAHRATGMRVLRADRIAEVA